MKRPVSLLIVALMLVATIMVPLEASAYSVGEIIDLNSESFVDNTSGNQNSETRTQEQIEQDNKNIDLNGKIDGIVDKLIQDMTESSYWYTVGEKVTGVDIVMKPYQVPMATLYTLGEIKSKYDPGHWHTWYEDVVSAVFDPIPPGGEEDYAFQEITDTIDNIPEPRYIKETINHEDWVNGGLIEWWDYKPLVKEWVDEREIPLLVPITEPIWVCETKTETAKWIKDYYWEWSWATETATVIYIKQYNIQETIKGAAKTETAQPWYGSPHTHYWEFNYIPEPGSADVQTMTKLDDAKTDVAFYHPGTYLATATQLVKTDHYNMLTYSTSEYLVLADTGMVIWQRHSKGGTSWDDSVFQKQVIGLNNSYYYRYIDSKYSYVTVFEKELPVTGEEAKKEKWKPNTPFGNIFTTVRIK